MTDPVSGQPDERGGVGISEPEWTREDDEARINRLRPLADHLRVGHDVAPDRRRYRDTWLHIALLADEWFEDHPTGDHGGLRGALADALCLCGDRRKHMAQCYRAADRALAVLAAHPEPEPAQDGE